MNKNVFLMLSGIVLSFATQAASIDCEKTRTQVEYLVCDRPWLSELDDAVAAAYNTVLRGSRRSSALRLSQKQWLKERDACDDADCVGRVYEDRLKTLMQQAALLNPSKSAYYMYLGWGKPLCTQVFTRLNEEIARKPKGPVCAFDILRDVPGLELPAWYKLDLHEHKALYKRYALSFLVDSKDWPQAFGEQPPKAGERMTGGLRPSVMPSDERLEQAWRDAIAINVQFYRLDKPVPRQEDGDVLLLEAWTPRESNCLTVRSRLFSEGLHAPTFNWSDYSKNFPFAQGGRSYQVSWDLGRRVGDDPIDQITDQVDISRVQNNERNEARESEMCRFFRNPPYFK